jgi:hypothetical protein
MEAPHPVAIVPAAAHKAIQAPVLQAVVPPTSALAPFANSRMASAPPAKEADRFFLHHTAPEAISDAKTAAEPDAADTATELVTDKDRYDAVYLSHTD